MLALPPAGILHLKTAGLGPQEAHRPAKEAAGGKDCLSLLPRLVELMPTAGMLNT